MIPKIKIKNKKAQMEFSWIFAVIVGAIILFLAFYFVGTKLLSQKQEQATVEAQSLDILLNPFSQLGEIAKASATPLALQQENTLTINCISEKLDGLGYNEIILAREGKEGISRITRDKYIFAEQNIETKKFQALSMPFEMPWRIADIIILWSYERKYCFTNAPQFIKEKLGNITEQGLNISSLYFFDSSNSCPEDSIKVCFGSGTCDIKVSITNTAQVLGSTNKQGSTIYFASEALMYASIFSDKELYNCNVQRLASRLYYETLVYEEKAKALSQRGCSATFNLASLKNAAKNIAEKTTKISSSDMQSLSTASQTIAQQNDYADCDLF